MTISFCTMLKAVLSYHNRTREALRPMFSMNNLFTILMFAVILVSKTKTYVISLSLFYLECTSIIFFAV